MRKRGKKKQTINKEKASESETDNKTNKRRVCVDPQDGICSSTGSLMAAVSAASSFSLFFKFSSVFCVFKDLISVSVSHNCRFIFRTFFKPTSGFCIQYLNFLQFFPFINCVTISFIAKTPLFVLVSSATILS